MAEGPLQGAEAWTETHPDDSTHNCSQGMGPGPHSALHRAAGSGGREGGTHFSRGSSSHPRAGHRPWEVLTVTVGDSPHHRPALNTRLLVQCPGSLHKACSPIPVLQERKQDQHGITWATVQAWGVMGQRRQKGRPIPKGNTRDSAQPGHGRSQPPPACLGTGALPPFSHSRGCRVGTGSLCILVQSQVFFPLCPIPGRVPSPLLASASPASR